MNGSISTDYWPIRRGQIAYDLLLSDLQNNLLNFNDGESGKRLERVAKKINISYMNLIKFMQEMSIKTFDRFFDHYSLSVNRNIRGLSFDKFISDDEEWNELKGEIAYKLFLYREKSHGFSLKLKLDDPAKLALAEKIASCSAEELKRFVADFSMQMMNDFWELNFPNT